jgi:hypothetical protein
VLSDLLTLDGRTTGVIDATAITAFSGTAAQYDQFLASITSGQVSAAANFGATVTDGASIATLTATGGFFLTTFALGSGDEHLAALHFVIIEGSGGGFGPARLRASAGRAGPTWSQPGGRAGPARADSPRS